MWPASKEVWYSIHRTTNTVKRVVWLTVMSLDGRAAGLTDARNFLLTVPVISEPLPRSIKPADGRQSSLKGSSASFFNVRGTAKHS